MNDNDFYRGIIWSISTCIDIFEESAAENLIEQSNLSLKQLKQIADEQDIEIITKYMIEVGKWRIKKMNVENLQKLMDMGFDIRYSNIYPQIILYINSSIKNNVLNEVNSIMKSEGYNFDMISFDVRNDILYFKLIYEKEEIE